MQAPATPPPPLPTLKRSCLLHQDVKVFLDTLIYSGAFHFFRCPKPLECEIGSQCTGDAQAWYAKDFNDSEWGSSELHPQMSSHEGFLQSENHPDWYRLHFALPAEPAHAWVPLKLQLSKCIGSGFIYLNGNPLGRYWQQGPQTDFYLPDCWLNRGGDNVIAMCLVGAHDMANIGSPPIGGVQDARITAYRDLAEVRP